MAVCLFSFIVSVSDSGSDSNLWIDVSVSWIYLAKIRFCSRFFFFFEVVISHVPFRNVFAFVGVSAVGHVM